MKSPVAQARSTDRTSDRKIKLVRLTPDHFEGRMWADRNDWIYDDVPFQDALREFEVDKARPLPKDMCWRRMESDYGTFCTTKIRPENQRSQLWACGRHMARYQEEVARELRIREQDAKKQRQRELQEWKLKEAVDAYERLKELGWGEYLEDRPPRLSYGSNLEYTTIKFDIQEFLALVESEQEEFEEEGEDGDYTEVSADFFETDDL